MKVCRLLLAAGVMLTTWQLTSALVLAAEEAGGSATAVNPLTVDPDLAIFTAVIFVVLLLFLSKFAWRPLMEGLDRREKSITDKIDEARQSAEQAAAKVQEYETQLAAATAEAEQIIQAARRDAATATEQIMAEARDQADRERRRALDDIEAAKNRAVQDVAQQSTELAFTLARKVIQREVTPADHASLIREALAQLPSEN